MRGLAVLLAFAFVSLVLASTALAEIDWTSNCTGGKFWRNATLCIGTSCSELTQPPIVCPSGCSENGLICNTADNVPNEYIMMSVLAFVLIAGLVFYISYKIGSTEGVTNTGSYISFMFMALGIVLIIIATGLLGSFFTAAPDSISRIVGVGYSAFIIVFILIVIIFLAEFLFGHLKRMKFKKGYR